MAGALSPCNRSRHRCAGKSYCSHCQRAMSKSQSLAGIFYFLGAILNTSTFAGSAFRSGSSDRIVSWSGGMVVRDFIAK